MSTTRLYHGAKICGYANQAGVAHAGQCWTTDYDAALVYAGERGTVWMCDLDLSDLTVEETEAYDHDNDEAPGDSARSRAAFAASGVDVLSFDDEDERGRSHDCIRLISERAVSMVEMVELETETEDA